MTSYIFTQLVISPCDWSCPHMTSYFPVTGYIFTQLVLSLHPSSVLIGLVMSPRDWLHRHMTGKGWLVPPGAGHTNCGQQRAFPEVQRAPWVRVLSVVSGEGCPPPQSEPSPPVSWPSCRRAARQAYDAKRGKRGVATERWSQLSTRGAGASRPSEAGGAQTPGHVPSAGVGCGPQVRRGPGAGIKRA